MAAFQKCETLGDGAHLWQIIQGQPEWEAMLDVAKKGKHCRLITCHTRLELLQWVDARNDKFSNFSSESAGLFFAFIYNWSF